MFQLTCEKCGWTWTPRVPNPRVCPKCKTYRETAPNVTSAGEAAPVLTLGTEGGT